MKVAFWDNQLCERGTTVSLFDYAYYNQKLLGNESYIFYDVYAKNNNTRIVENFNKHFTVHATTGFEQVDKYLVEYGIDHIYIIKSGQKDTRLSKVAKNCVHCVFNCMQPHGEVYSSVSPYVRGNNGRYPVVPHMINIPTHHEHMREHLGIPSSSIVFGNYAGKKQFDIPYVHEAVYNVARSNPNIYFIYANVQKFCEPLPNIIHLPTIVTRYGKTRFINTCDAMLWGRRTGETFGLAIGEFSSLNKPVIATKNTRDQAHVGFLNDKAIWYESKEELTQILTKYNREEAMKTNWNAYKDYTPEKVMKIFNRVYLNEN